MKNFIKKPLSLFLHLFPTTWVKKLPGKQRFYLYVFMGALFVVLIPLAIATLQRPSQSEAAWYNDNWLYRAEIPVSAHTSAENNVYITVTLDTATPITAGKMQTDCGDLRFTKNNGELLPYFINASPGCNNVATTIQVNFDTFPAGAQTLYYYYGNPSAPNGFSASAFATAATNATIGTIGSEAKGKGPVAYWKFDEGTGTTTSDSTINKNNGPITGATWQTEDQCVSGKCLYFNGASGTYIRIPNASQRFLSLQSTSFTLQAWVKHNDTGIARGLLAKDARSDGNRGYMFHLNTNNTLRFIITSTGNTADYKTTNGVRTVSPNVWHLVTVVFVPSTSISLYVDGQLDVTDTTSIPSGPYNNTAAFDIGTSNTGDLYTGFLDEPKVYNYARSAAEVKTDYSSRGSVKGVSASLGSAPNNNFAALSNGLVGYWKQDEATWSGTTNEVVDSSGNGNHGTAQGLTGNKAYPTNGKFGNSGNFIKEGSHYVSTSDSDTLDISASQDLTLSLWFKTTDSMTAIRGLAGKTSTNNVDGIGYAIRFNSSTNIRFSIKDNSSNSISSSVTASNAVNDGNWHFLTMAFKRNNSTGFKIFLDGSQVGSSFDTTSITDTLANSSGFRIGSMTEYWNGQIDEVRFYNRALSPSEVSQLYNWAPGPVGYWDFEEGQGTSANDKSGNGLTGTLNSNPTRSAGKYGKALGFGGDTSGKYVNISNNSKLEIQQLTLSAWVKRSTESISSGHGAGIISKGNGANNGAYEIITNSSASVTFRDTDLSNTSWAPGYTLPVNEWKHIAFAWNGSNIYFYVDGKLFGSTSLTGTISYTTSNALTIGARQVVTTNANFAGIIDDVRIYNYARTQKQIVSDMNASHPAVGSPVGSQYLYYKFDEGYGTTSQDSSINKLNATLTNTVWSTNGKFGKSLFFGGAARTTNSAFSTPGSITVSAWINHSISSSYKWVLGKEGAFTIGIGPSTFYGYINDGTTGGSDSNGWNNCSPTVSISQNTWHQVTLSYDNRTQKVYLDGKLLKTCAFSLVGDSDGEVDAGSGNFTVGDLGTRNVYFSGLIDDVKVYAYALTDDEVKLDYNRGQNLVLGALSDTSGVTGGSVASNSASALYCIPGDTSTCTPPVGEWNFEERQGTTANNTGTDTTSGTISNGTWTSGKVGPAVSYNGTSSVTSVSSSTYALVGSSSFTVETWIYPTAASTSNPRILSFAQDSTNGYSLVRNNPSDCTGSSFIFEVKKANTNYGAGCAANSSVENKWYHVAGTFNGSTNTAILYVNGVAVTAGGGGFYSLPTTTNTLYIGAKEASAYWPGKVDQVRVYNYVRTPAQVAWDYNRGGPVGWWKMDECQGSTAYDKSGNNLSGTIASAASLGTCTTSDGDMWKDGATGKFNSSLDFDNTVSDNVQVADTTTLRITDELSVCSWVKSGQTSMNGGIFEKTVTQAVNTSYLLFAEGTVYKWRAIDATGAQTLSGQTTLTTLQNSWAHICGTFSKSDNGAAKIYINGKQDNSTNFRATSLSTGAGISYIGVLGQTGGVNVYPYNGQIDDARVYNYALTPLQVKLLYNENSSVRFGPASGTP